MQDRQQSCCLVVVKGAVALGLGARGRDFRVSEDQKPGLASKTRRYSWFLTLSLVFAGGSADFRGCLPRSCRWPREFRCGWDQLGGPCRWLVGSWPCQHAAAGVNDVVRYVRGVIDVVRHRGELTTRERCVETRRRSSPGEDKDPSITGVAHAASAVRWSGAAGTASSSEVGHNDHDAA